MLVLADDLMSLLDAGIHADHPSVIIDSEAMFSEDMFGYSTLRGRSMLHNRAGSSVCFTLCAVIFARIRITIFTQFL